MAGHDTTFSGNYVRVTYVLPVRHLVSHIPP